MANEPSAETKALILLRNMGFEFVQQLDWIGKKDGEWVVFEIKEKELYTPGKDFPYYGAGLNKAQLYLRTRLLQDLRLRTYLLMFAKGTNKVYAGYLDELERKGDFYDTKNRIRIYPLSSFTKLTWGDKFQSDQTPLPYSHRKSPTIKNKGGKNGG